MGFSEFGEGEGQGFWTEFYFEQVCVMKTTLQEENGSQMRQKFDFKAKDDVNFRFLPSFLVKKFIELLA